MEALFSRVLCHIFRQEVDSDVMSGVAEDNVSMDVRVKFGAYRSNGLRDIRGADFVSNERTNESYPTSAKRLTPKIVARANLFKCIL